MGTVIFHHHTGAVNQNKSTNDIQNYIIIVGDGPGINGKTLAILYFASWTVA